MLVSAKEMLNKAHKEGYGVAQININNLEWTKTVLQTVNELKISSDLRCIRRCS